jgi:hypothetical protein
MDAHPVSGRPVGRNRMSTELNEAIPIPLDTGPIYQETVMGRLPVEPWNTFSNLVFLVVVIYWSWRVYPQAGRHVFLSLALPVLFIGFIGGTIYHATRDHVAWLLMDWLPIVLLCLSCTVLFARRAGLPWSRLIPLLLLPFALRWLMTDVLQWSVTVVLNVEYALIGAVVLAPLVLHLYKAAWRGAGSVATAIGFFALALLFRVMDHHPMVAWMPMGTHWLWHFMGGTAVHFLIAYIHQDDLRRMAAAIPGSTNSRMAPAV